MLPGPLSLLVTGEECASKRLLPVVAAAYLSNVAGANVIAPWPVTHPYPPRPRERPFYPVNRRQTLTLIVPAQPGYVYLAVVRREIAVDVSRWVSNIMFPRCETITFDVGPPPPL